MLTSYEGGCHCGRVRFRIEVDLAETTIGECNCSICTKKGILHLPVACVLFFFFIVSESIEI